MTAEGDFATYLASGGFGTAGTDIFVNTLPATPDNCISVTGYAGMAPERTHDTSGNARPSVQVRVRNTSAGTARTKIGQIFDYLDGISNTTLTGHFYLSIAALQSPESMGTDENGRHEWVCNFSTIQRR